MDNLIKKTFSLRLDPNNVQITFFNKCAGAYRWVYNWALQQKKEFYDLKQSVPDGKTLGPILTKVKQNSEEWLYDVPSSIASYAIDHADLAFHHFIIGDSKSFPPFKNKKSNKQTFKFTSQSIEMWDGEYIELPIIGKVKVAERNYIPKNKKISVVQFVNKFNQWYVNIKLEVKIRCKHKNEKVVGVDVGIKNLATCSDGKRYCNIRPYQNNESKLKILNRRLSRKVKGSKNYEKARVKFGKFHQHISNIRKDYLHKITSKIVSENQTIVLEEINVRELIKNNPLACKILDVSFNMFRRFIEYKCDWHQKQCIVADKYFPSSKKCFKCGQIKKDLTLTDRIYKCNFCHFQMDRDLMASKNLESLSTGSYSGIHAFGKK